MRVNSGEANSPLQTSNKWVNTVWLINTARLSLLFWALILVLAVNKTHAAEVCETITLDWSAQFSNGQLDPVRGPQTRTLGTTFPSEFTYDASNNAGNINSDVINLFQNGQFGVRVFQNSVFPSAGSTITWTWNEPVLINSFEIVDIDAGNNFTDRVAITIIDENGATVDLVPNPGGNYQLEGTSNVIVEDAPNQFTGTAGVSNGNNADIRVEPDVKVKSVTLVYSNADTTPSFNQAILLKDFTWESCASLSIDKPAPVISTDVAPVGTVSAGDTLTYTITATNDGNTTQTGVVVSDPLLTPDSETCASVDPGDTCVLTGTYDVGLADVGTTINNIASVISDQITTPTTDNQSTPVSNDASPPVARDDSADAAGATSVTLDIIGNDEATVGNLDPESFSFDPASVGGTCTATDADGDCVSVSVPGQGVWTVDTTGMVTFASDPSFAGAPTPIDYTIRDERGVPSNVAIIRISTLTPVTLSSVSSERLGDKVTFNWSTSSELFNVGFQLWGLDGSDQSWEKLHGWLIRSGSGNAVEAQSYAKTVRLPSAITELVAVGISSVDSDGSEHYYGPFEVGQAYGNLSSLKPIAWNHVRAQVDAQMRARGYVKDRVLGYRKVAAAAASADTQSVVEFNLSKSGLYRITAQQLLNAGVDWASISKRDIAVLDNGGNAVVRYITATGSGNGASKLLGDRGELYFYATGVDNVSGLYTNSSVYRLVLDRHRALAAQFQGKRGITGSDSAHYLDTVRVERDTQYSLSSAADDPWLDTVILSHSDQPTSYAVAVPVEADALWGVDAQLTLNLARSSALTPVDVNGDGIADSEHRVEAVVLSNNGVGGLVSLGRDAAVGAGTWTPQFTISGGTPLTLIDGNVVVGGLFNAGIGYRLSEVHVDSVELNYARPYSARANEDYLHFTAPDDGAQAFSVTVPEKGWPLVFAQSNGKLVRLGLESQQKQTDANGKAQRRVRFAALDGSATSLEPIQYWVSGKGGLLTVQDLSTKLITTSASLITQAQGADLLMVAHPVFMTPALSDYAAFKRTQGFNVAIINYLDVVDAYGGGQAGPTGLTQYLNAVSTHGTLSHVLLVGGSSYDHTDKLGTGAMTFIPGHYGHSAYSNYTVTDTPYVSDATNTLFASIGRWPVRTQADLKTIIANSRVWSNTDHSQGNVLAIAEHTVVGENIDFGGALEGVLTQLPTSWTADSVHVDAIRANNPSLTLAQALVQAKTQLIAGLEAGPDVVMYNGHGTTSQLSNKGLFKASDVAGVNGNGAQLWVPMSCYMTYFESTHVNTLAHQLLFSGKAVGISGAMLLSNQSQNIDTGKALLNSTVEQGASIGEAITAHKQAQSNPGLSINLNHLGDPTLRM